MVHGDPAATRHLFDRQRGSIRPHDEVAGHGREDPETMGFHHLLKGGSPGAQVLKQLPALVRLGCVGTVEARPLPGLVVHRLIVPREWSHASPAQWQRLRLPLLLGRSDQHLVDRHMPRPGDDVGDGVGDVRRLHPRPELATHRLEYLGPVVPCKLRGGGSGFDQ